MEMLFQNQMRNILEKEYRNSGKAVWEAIRDNELTAVPAFKGSMYDQMDTKIMYIGHAVNGWKELDATVCSSLDEVLDCIISQPNGLNTLVNANGYPFFRKNGTKGKYYHIRSGFFRLIKQILEYQNESEKPTTGGINDLESMEHWYHDSKYWNQKIVWYNLFPIAERKGENPAPDFVKPDMDKYVHMFRTQIEYYKPHIAVVCPLNGWFRKWKRCPSFEKELDTYSLSTIQETIIGEGKIGDTNIIVCKRPDSRGNSYNDVQKMAKCISDYINTNVKTAKN